MKKNNFDYDDLSDSLIISRKRPNEIVQGSAEVGDLILDFTSNGKIVNIEFQNISKYLKLMNFNPHMLNELEGAELITQKQRGAILLLAKLKTPNLNQTIPLANVPVSQQLTSSV